MSLPPPDPQYILRGSGAQINTLHFRCDNEGPPLLFSGSGNGAVHVWNLNTRRPEKVLEGHSSSSIIWVSTLNSRETLISQGRDMRVCVWDLGEGRGDVTEAFVTGSVGFCQCSLLETSPGRWLLAYPGEQMEEVRVAEFPSLIPVCSLKPDSKAGMLMSVKIWQKDSGGCPEIVAGYEDGSVVLWDVTQRRPVSCLKVYSEPVMCLDFDSGRLKGASGSSEKVISSWTIDEKQNLQMHDSVELVNPGISQLRVRDDGKILASAGWDNNLRVFAWKKKLRPLAVLKHHTDMVLSVGFSDHHDPRQRLLAAGSKDQRISLWSIYNQS
ncbi:guanine nucleotide-binding protein subunit beta-like protein 1 [Chanos chanos]|uniref:Guanine nucleotide-binding protein subunit beta-like protein 1 n=1 Tax=Chanos chanos TaxID=29144 RepID=A0A6J2WUB0_CHACN|nr:guanine nucleotide-binding protein subunit beta-like protein 1 [Chanos chanos]